MATPQRSGPPAPGQTAPGPFPRSNADDAAGADTHAPNEWARMVRALDIGLTRRLAKASDAREAIRRIGR